MAEPENGSSPLAEALARGGDRWTLLVVEALLGGPQRFNDLLGQIPGIAANILSERLKRLEREGLLISRSYSERPPRAAYQLTAEGDRKSTRLNSSHSQISYAVFCLKKKKNKKSDRELVPDALRLR